MIHNHPWSSLVFSEFPFERMRPKKQDQRRNYSSDIVERIRYEGSVRNHRGCSAKNQTPKKATLKIIKWTKEEGGQRIKESSILMKLPEFCIGSLLFFNVARADRRLRKSSSRLPRTCVANKSRGRISCLPDNHVDFLFLQYLVRGIFPPFPANSAIGHQRAQTCGIRILLIFSGDSGEILKIPADISWKFARNKFIRRFIKGFIKGFIKRFINSWSLWGDGPEVDAVAAANASAWEIRVSRSTTGAAF